MNDNYHFVGTWIASDGRQKQARIQPATQPTGQRPQMLQHTIDLHAIDKSASKRLCQPEWAENPTKVTRVAPVSNSINVQAHNLYTTDLSQTRGQHGKQIECSGSSWHANKGASLASVPFACAPE